MASDMSPTDEGHLNDLDTEHQPISNNSASTISTSINNDADQKDNLSDLFQEVERLVASPPTLIEVTHGQPAPEPSDLYNPSLITPGAPCLPSARHKIAKLPYHLSTDHHSASLFFSNSLTSPEALTEGSRMVPRKRSHPSRHHEETPRKRSRRPPHDSSSPIPPIVPQKRRRIFNDLEVLDCKRPRPENEYLSQPQANPTNHKPGIRFDGAFRPVYRDPQTDAQPDHTPVTQCSYQKSQNLDTTDHIPAPEFLESTRTNDFSSHLNPKTVEHSSDAAQYISDDPNSSSKRSKSRSSLQGYPLDLPSEYAQRTDIESCAHPQEPMTQPVSCPQMPPSASTSCHPSLTQSPQRSRAHQQPTIRQEEPEYDHTRSTDPAYEGPQSHDPTNSFKPPHWDHTTAHGSSSHHLVYADEQISPRSHSYTPQETSRRELQHPPGAQAQHLSRSLNLPVSLSQYTINPSKNPRAQSQDAARKTFQEVRYADAQIPTSRNRPSSFSPDVAFKLAPANTLNTSKISELPSDEVSTTNNVHNQPAISLTPHTSDHSTHSPPRMWDGLQFEFGENRVPGITLPAVTPAPPTLNTSKISVLPSDKVSTTNNVHYQPEISLTPHTSYHSTHSQPRTWDGFQFEFGENHVPGITLPAVTPVPPQSFNPHPKSQQTQLPPASLDTPHDSRLNSTMPLYSPEFQQNPAQSASQSSRSVRMSSRSRDFQHDQCRSASQSGRSSRMSFCSSEFQQNQDQSASQSGQSVRMSSCSRDFQHYQDTSASQSGRSTRMSIRSRDFQQYQDSSRSQSRRSSRMSFRPKNNHQPNPSPDLRATYQHPPLLLPSRNPTSHGLHHQFKQTGDLRDIKQYDSDHNRIPHQNGFVFTNPSRAHSQRSHGPSHPPNEHLQTFYGATLDPNSPAHLRTHTSQLDNTATASNLQGQSISQPREAPIPQQPDVGIKHTQPSPLTNPGAYANLQERHWTTHTHIASHSNKPPRSHIPTINPHVSGPSYERDHTTYNSQFHNSQLPNQTYRQAQFPSSTHATYRSRPQDVACNLAPDYNTRNLNDQSWDSHVHTQIQHVDQSMQQERSHHRSILNPIIGHAPSRGPASSFPSVSSTPHQAFDLHPNDGASPHERIIFQQHQTQPSSLNPIIGHAPSSGPAASLPSVSSARPQACDVGPNAGPSRPKHIVFQQHQTQPATLTKKIRTPQSSNTPNINHQSWDSHFHNQNQNDNQSMQQDQLNHRSILNPTIGHPPSREPPLSFPSVSAAPHQAFNLRPNDGPSQPEHIVFQQHQTQPIISTTLPCTPRSSRMSINSADYEPNQRPSPRQHIQSQRMSLCTSNDQQPSDRQGSEHDMAEDDVQEVDKDTDESDSPGVFDLVEDRMYQNRGASRRARDTMARHDVTRYERLAKPPVECSPYERLTIAIHHYHNILLGIVRKGKGRKGHRLLPPPPSDEEYSIWDKRKLERRRIIDKSVEKAQSHYRRKHPQPHPAQLTKVGDRAAEDALATIPPVKFASLVALRNSGVHYSTTVASTCEGALALSGFTRFTYDWTDTIKSRWNEAISSIILQEWEKCYKRGDADDYNIDVNHVTAKNLREVLDRWFNTKAREYVSQCNKPTRNGNEIQAKQQEAAAKEKSRRRESQKRVCKLRQNTFKTFFPQHRDLQAIISERSIHSEDEVDSAGHSYRKPKLWRHQDLNEFLHELDALYIKDQQGDQAITSAYKTLNRGPYAAAEDADFLGQPPKGFPKVLLDQQFMNQHVSRVGVFGLDLSAHPHDLRPLIAHVRWLQLPESSS